MSPKRDWSDSIRDKVDKLKRAVDLRDLFMERYPGRFRRSGRWLYGSSPYREDRHPSFAVNEDVFIDFATGESGDEIDFLMVEQNLSFGEAVDALEARAGGIILPTADYSSLTSFLLNPGEPPVSAWQVEMEAACRRAQAYLFSNAQDARAALDWLQKRGLNRNNLVRAGIGCNPSWQQTRLREKDTGKYVSIAPGILIPCTVDNVLWSVHVRILEEGLAGHRTGEKSYSLPKYLYVRGSKTGVLYNGDALHDDCTVLIVEGEFDALLAQQELGNQAVVVTLGSAANRLPHRWLERLKAARNVFSCLDRDEAGARATAHLADLLGAKHHVLHLPAGKDITEFVVNHAGSLKHWWRLQAALYEPIPTQLPLPDTPSVRS
jgi:DNA primase